MKEQCPQCGHQFGWRGPRRDVQTTGRWRTNAAGRYFCSACGAELEHRQPRIERIAWFVNALSLLVLIGGLMLRENFIARVPDAVLIVAALLASISFVAGAFVWARAKHFIAANCPAEALYRLGTVGDVMKTRESR